MSSRYKIPSLEVPINRLIGFIFYYRLLWVIIAVIITSCLSYSVWESSAAEDKLKNCAVVFTGGSIIIGIFYSLINYEHNQAKFKHDVKSSKEILTFNTAIKMHEAETINHFRNVDLFYREHKTKFLENKYSEIDIMLKEKASTRVSFIVILNYFEGIAIGIDQGIMDEVFMKSFFRTIFTEYISMFSSYIEYLQKAHNSDRIFCKFCSLANKWKNE